MNPRTDVRSPFVPRNGQLFMLIMFRTALVAAAIGVTLGFGIGWLFRGWARGRDAG